MTDIEWQRRMIIRSNRRGMSEQARVRDDVCVTLDGSGFWTRWLDCNEHRKAAIATATNKRRAA